MVQFFAMKIFIILKMTKKLKIGVFSVTGCAGCQLSIIFNEDELLSLLDLVELHAFPFIKEVNANENFDCVFMEGLIATNEDLKIVKKIRKNTKLLVALGACACTGCIPAYRNFTIEKRFHQAFKHTVDKIKPHLKSINPTPIDVHIPVDFHIPGCPPEKSEILKNIYNLTQGLPLINYTEPVCVECRRQQNLCLLEINKPCLGPITQGGCKAVCPNGGFECWGCRGHTADANIKVLYNLLKEKGYQKKGTPL